MAAGANPSGNHQHNSAFDAVSAAVNGNSENSGMTHIPSPGISTDWTVEEQTTLEEGLSKVSGLSPIIRYAKIALTLPNKTVRDVALRCRYMNRELSKEGNSFEFVGFFIPENTKDSIEKKEISKRRKEEASRKTKDKREKVSEPLSKPSRPANHPYPVPPVSIDDDGVSYKVIGGPIGELLELNVQAYQKISTNFSSYQLQENINLFRQARDNIVKILSSLNETPEIMNQMPPLPVKLNEDLASSILPSTSHLL